MNANITLNHSDGNQMPLPWYLRWRMQELDNMTDKKQQQKKTNHRPPSFQPKHPRVKSFYCVGVVAAFFLLGCETGAGAEEFYFMGLHSCDDTSPADHGLFVAV